MKPILLLDVDGVINVPPTWRKDPIRIKSDRGHNHYFYPNRVTPRFMRMAWKLFDVRWLTAWVEDANVLAKYYGLEERPVIIWRDSKATAAEHVLQGHTGPVGWIEDGVDNQAKEIIKKHGWRYFHCDPFVGVTLDHFRDVRRFAEENA